MERWAETLHSALFLGVLAELKLELCFTPADQFARATPLRTLLMFFGKTTFISKYGSAEG